MRIPLSLYIHFPWCIQKCPYCDFNSHTAPKAIPQENYIQRLLEDLDTTPMYHRSLHSIFMGGGTPSLFAPDQIKFLLDEIAKRFHLPSGMEITLEANPGTVDESRFRGFHQAGVNRLSIGVQSFNPQLLKTLGRIHDDIGAKRAIAQAIDAGFSNFNLDLMHGLPQQTEEQALIDLEHALAFSPPHLSWYQLTIEPNTVFYKQRPHLPDDEVLANIQQAGEKLLAAQGYEHYEISAFTKGQQYSQHNLNYWQFGDYLGIGAGAHAKLTLNGNVHRHWRTRQPKDYLNPEKSMLAGNTIVSVKKLPFEFMLNAMRLYQPIQRALFESRTGLAWEELIPTLKQAQAKNLLQFDAGEIILTDKGYYFLNDVLELFM